MKIAHKIGSHKRVGPLVAKSWQLIGKVKSWCIVKSRLLSRPKFDAIPYEEPRLHPPAIIWPVQPEFEPEFFTPELPEPGFPELPEPPGDGSLIPDDPS